MNPFTSWFRSLKSNPSAVADDMTIIGRDGKPRYHIDGDNQVDKICDLEDHEYDPQTGACSKCGLDWSDIEKFKEHHE